MEKNTGTQHQGREAAKTIELRRLCLDHASDLIVSAERVLGSDNAHPHIAFHLAILTLEEIAWTRREPRRELGAAGR